MKCVVLAAGYATRLYPLTENFPKSLLEVNGRTILDYLLGDIDKIEEIDGHVIVSNHKYFEHFKAWADSSTLIKKPISVIDDKSISNETRMGAVKDIQFAIESLGLQNDDLLVIAGDNLLDFSLKGFVEFSKEKNASVVMCSYEEDLHELRRCGVMLPDENMKLLSMEEKPQEPKSNWCVGPFYIYRKEDTPLIAKGIKEGCGVDAPGSLVCYLCEKTSVYGYVMPGKRYDIGDLESYEYVKSVYNYKVD